MVTTTKCQGCGKSRVLESMIQGFWVCHWCYVEYTADKEWEDGDDSALEDKGYDEGYADGAYDAITIIRKNGHPEISAIDVLRALAIRKVSDSLAK
jgi:hypothetical protein